MEAHEVTSSDAGKSNDFEMKCGLTIAVFAAALAVTDLFGGKFGDDEIKVTNEKASAYMWYQSKSIKETILEGQQSLLQSLIEAQAVQADKAVAIQRQIASLNEQVLRYSKEKKEILVGSSHIEPENWVQEVEGQKGKVIGAQELAEQASRLGATGDRLDLATLFLQLCLVLGAIALVLKSEKLQKTFYRLMCVMGVVGTALSGIALMQAPWG